MLLFSITFSFVDLISPNISTLLIIPLFILIFRNYKHLKIIKIASLILSLIISGFTQQLSMLLVIKLFHLSTDLHSKEAILFVIVVSIINYFLSLLIIMLIRTIILRKNLKKYFTDKTVKIIILISSILFISFYIIINYLTKKLSIQLTYLNTTIFITFSTFIFTFIGMLTFINAHIKELRTNFELDKSRERNMYIKELERKNIELKKFKHDYKNLLLSLSISLKSNGITNDAIQELLNYTGDGADTDTEIENSNVYRLNNDLVRGIIITKMFLAKEQKIKTHLEIDQNINIPKRDSIELTRILGIILDNAIEACLMTQQPKLNFAIISFDNYIEFIVKNNVKSSTSINLNKIYTSGYTTKENHTGLGLSSVKDIVDSNSDFMTQTKNEDGYYSIILTILKGK